MKRNIIFTFVLLWAVAQGAWATTTDSNPYCPEGLYIDNDYTSSQAGYYYANLVKGQNVTVTLAETNLVFKVYDHGGKNGDYSSDDSGNTQSMTFNAPEGCVFVISGIILGIEGYAGDTFELYDGQNRFYFYDGEDYVVIDEHVTTSNCLKIRLNTPQSTSNPGFALTVRVWDGYTEVSTSSQLTAAVADGAKIRLTNDITLPAYLSIGYDTNQNVSIDQTVILDLNGHTLRRNLSAADANGHVIEVHSKGNLTITDSSGDNSGTISGGWANNGGGICNYGTVNLAGGTITGCQAAQQGGGIKNNANSTLTITGGIITGNSAPNGGGIYNNGTINISGATITGNRADIKGGGIYYANGSTGTVNGTVISGNSSPEGGGLNVEKTADITFYDPVIKDNTSTVYGGGGITNYGTLSFDGLTITGNYSKTDGGGIWNNGTITISGATITDNRTDKTGGGIHCAQGGNITIGAGSVITKNASPNGGGIYGIEGSTLSISGCTVTANTASEDGGGIVNRGTLTVGDGTSITGNTCKNNGGGLWSIGTLNMSGTVTVQDNARISGLTNNVFLKTNCIITVTGNLGGSLIGLTLVGNNGVVTSGCAAYGATIDNFTNDAPTIATLGMSDGEVRLSQKTDVIYYVERSWNATSKKVEETIKTVPVSECTFLDGTDNTVEYNTSSSKPYLVVRGTNAYKIITVSGNRSLILCDGASLSGDTKNSIIRIDKNCQLNIYGQMYDTGLLKDGAIRVPANRTLNIHGGTINAINEVSESAAIGGDSVDDRDCGVITIYGGTITATVADRDGHDTSAGIGAAPEGLGGIITIYGGTVTARGGSADGTTNSGAGIGGGGNGGSGGTINIHGGTVYAYGGDDAAGIGSGEESVFSHSNGGNITITGGTVYAYGKDEGAGIGAGQYADAGNIKILGGYVYAEGGENSMAICSHDDSEGENSFEVGDQMMVTSERTFTAGERIDAINGRRTVTIQPCTHSGATYTVRSATTHGISCPYCKTSSLPHTFGSYSECSACHLVSLADDAPNGESISHWQNSTKSIVLTGRTLWKDGDWNTLCLPFDVTDFNGTPLAGATVKTLETSSFSDGTLTLNFTEDANNLTAIEAGTPYLVKWDKPIGYDGHESDYDISDPVFSGVTFIHKTAGNAETEWVDFVGTYSPEVIYESSSDKTKLYLGSSSALYHPLDEGFAVNACRAYFQLKGLTAGTPASSARAFVLNFGDGDATGVASPYPSPEGKGTTSPLLQEGTGEALFDLTGRRIDGIPTAKGVYIVNGKKIIIK